MNHKNDLTQEQLKSIFNYNPDTGKFIRKVACPGNQKGREAGCISHGYVVIRVDNELYQAHRLAWLYMTGSWPQKHVDHKSMVKNDNRWCNLREATQSLNGMNKLKQSNNKSGHKGVYWSKQRNKWHSKICVNGNTTSLGFFLDLSVAAKAYKDAADKYHGEFARVD